uniref:Probable DNA polymerase n=1 Tax=Coniophora puteana TaxID=80637 RepID=A0A896Z9N6_9AGAM
MKTSYIQPLDYVDPATCNTQKEYEQKVSRKKNSSAPNLTKIGTLDIETVVREGVHYPYLYSFCDGIRHHSWFTSTGSDLLKHLLSSNTYRNFTVYAHNLSRFDIIFLLRDIARLKEEGYIINIIKKDDKIISINIKHIKDDNINLTLKDSLLLLPASLDKLAKNFKLEVGKLVQPVYVGAGHEDYKDTDLSHFSKEVEQVSNFEEWQRKVEIYCQQDCKALHDVLVHFIKLVWNKWQVSAINYPTTPSLAFAIYRVGKRSLDRRVLTVIEFQKWRVFFKRKKTRTIFRSGKFSQKIQNKKLTND